MRTGTCRRAGPATSAATATTSPSSAAGSTARRRCSRSATTFGLWLRGDWKSGFGLANRVYRVSEPLNLNTFTPTYATKLAGKAQTAIYTTDVRGIANDLAPFEAADWPFLTLSTRSEATDLMRDSGREYHEKFLWPA
jgi:hypothetical protein